MAEQRYCKRLIEVDLPIKRISEHAKREKSIRQGHISSLHIWWARRPLASCRAVLCASLWPDPVDSACPAAFREGVTNLLREFRDKRGGKDRNFSDLIELRCALLEFIADFADWDNAQNRDFIDVSQRITKIAYESLGGTKGGRPIVIDPFAGGGAIPVEALRIGAQSYANDINPVAVLLEKLIIEYIPTFGERLERDLEKYASMIVKELKDELEKFYPSGNDGAKPLAYLWCRTVMCEGPNCGALIPLQSDMNILTSGKRSVNFKVKPEGKKISFEIFEGAPSSASSPTVKRSSAICPICGFTTKATNVRAQFKGRKGGANDAQMVAVMDDNCERTRYRRYRSPTSKDLKAFEDARRYLKDKVENFKLDIPNEPFPYLRSIFNMKLLDVNSWGDLFNDRQKLINGILVHKINQIYFKIEDKKYAEAVIAVLSLLADKIIDSNSSVCFKVNNADTCMRTFGRQALPIVWDFFEINPLGKWARGLEENIAAFSELIRLIYKWDKRSGEVMFGSATNNLLPEDSVDCIVTDPPYYDAIPYADLSDFYFVWLKRIFKNTQVTLFREQLSPKREEIVQLFDRNIDYVYKTKENYINLMMAAMTEGRKSLKPDGIAVVIFAHKATDAWEAQLDAMIKAGWVICGSWPIDSENDRRLRAQSAAVLSSSIHLVCRPREDSSGKLIANHIGDWRDVLHELPKRIHEWMPKLSQEGVVGADAIFACLGPALEIFSQYSRVEKANGEQVELKEYLEQVWGAVAKEALNMIFQGAHTEGFEEDARITAMWLWTLSAGLDGSFEVDEETTDDTDSDGEGTIKAMGFSLEFDAARKIAQGLGAHLENLSSVIEIDGDQARLLPVAERVKFLFGKGSMAATPVRKKKKENQITLFDEFSKVEDQGWSLGDEKSAVGKTILDRLHQAMILFGAGRGDAMRRFLVEEGIGKDERFWRLAQAFSALYPANTNEKRWVDGVLARKKGLGL